MGSENNKTGILKNAAIVFGKMLIVVIICNFVCLSLQMVATTVFTEVRGYSVYGYKGENSNDAVFLYEYYTADGEDENADEYLQQGYTLQKRSIRTDMFPVGRVVFLVVAQAACFITLVGFIHTPIFKCGTSDSNAVAFGRRKYDRLKGIKIGLLAAVPSFVIYIIFVVLSLCGKTASADAYTVFNAHLFSLLKTIYWGKNDFCDFGAVQYIITALTTLIMPAAVAVSYQLGFKNISLAQKIIYKGERD